MLNEPFNLTGKLALVTGGGTGLGLGISKAFIQGGARVIVVARREEILKKACKKLGDMADYLVGDITQLDTLPGLVKEVETEYAPINILVNNAGINLKKIALKVSNQEFKKIIETNLTGLFALTREVGKKMVSRKQGSIIMISSMAALYGLPKVSAYAASKSGVVGMIRVLASDLSPYGVRINAIAPGFIESPMLLKAMEADPDRKRRILERTPIGTFGNADDIGYAAVYLASEASKFVTGVNLPVDGGNAIGF